MKDRETAEKEVEKEAHARARKKRFTRRTHELHKSRQRGVNFLPQLRGRTGNPGSVVWSEGIPSAGEQGGAGREQKKSWGT